MLTRRFESQSVIDVSGDRPQLFASFDRIEAQVREMFESVPVTCRAQSIDRAQETV